MKREGKTPEVSVIMGVYNQYDKEALYEAVRSILTQTYRDFEFLVWDDGSDKEAAEHVARLAELDPRITVFGRDENRGLAFSLNECIRLARGKYIARMDADDVSHPERLAKQVVFLNTHPEYGWCGTDAELFDQDGTWGIRKMPEEPGMRDFLRFSPYIHPSVMFRASLFAENGGYLTTAEALRCEDYEIFLRLTRRGQRGYNLNEPLFRYRETYGSYQKRNVRARLNEAKMRFRGFKEAGELFPMGWLSALRPLAACLVPSGLLALLKRSEGKMRKLRREADGIGRRSGAAPAGIPAVAAERSSLLRGA